MQSVKPAVLIPKGFHWGLGVVKTWPAKQEQSISSTCISSSSSKNNNNNNIVLSMLLFYYL